MLLRSTAELMGCRKNEHRCGMKLRQMTAAEVTTSVIIQHIVYYDLCRIYLNQYDNSTTVLLVATLHSPMFGFFIKLW
ncbi:MAG: hypothetical protein Q4C00_04370 [Bacillota bacterium]|nr:hypothetical protein [Bacillota bacterium]